MVEHVEGPKKGLISEVTHSSTNAKWKNKIKVTLSSFRVQCYFMSFLGFDGSHIGSQGHLKKGERGRAAKIHFGHKSQQLLHRSLKKTFVASIKGKL